MSDLFGNQTSVAPVAQDADSAAVLVEDGVAIDVPSDPNDGIAIDSHTGSAVIITPTDGQLSDFEAAGTTAVAEGDGYSTVAQPLEDGDFRLAVVLDNASAPNTLSYQLELDPGTQPVMRPDGGFDFVAPDGTTAEPAPPGALMPPANPSQSPTRSLGTPSHAPSSPPTQPSSP